MWKNVRLIPAGSHYGQDIQLCDYRIIDISTSSTNMPGWNIPST